MSMLVYHTYTSLEVAIVVADREERSIELTYELTSFASPAFDARGVDDFGFRDRVKWFRFSPSFVVVSIVRPVLAFP